MLFIIILISFSFLSNLICFYYDLEDRHPFLFLWLFNIPFVFFPMVFWVFYDKGWYDFLLRLNLFILLCNFTYLIWSSVLSHSVGFGKLSAGSCFVDRNSRLPNLFFILFALLMGYTIFVNFGSFLSAKRTSLHPVLIYLAIFVSSFVIHYFKTSRYKFLLIVSFLFFWFLMYKSRGALAYSLMPVLFYFIVTNFSIKKLIYLFVMGLLLIALVVAMKAYRWSTASGAFDFEHFLWTWGYQWSSIFTIGDLSIIKWAKIAFDMCMVSESTCGAFTELKKFGLVFFNDSSSVKSSAYLIWDYYHGESDVRGSLHALSYGISFLDGYWFGFIYFVFLAFLRFLVLVQIKKGMSILIIAPALYFVTFFSRGSVFNGFFPFFVALLINYLFYVFFDRLVLFSKKNGRGFC